MRVWISVDLEGVSGVVLQRQIKDQGPEYEAARKLMTLEANAAVEGALAGGASEVVVNDSHSHMQNILPELLNPAAVLISGENKPLSMVQGVEGASAAFFVGYHAQAGTSPAVIDHTYAGVVRQVRLNGRPMGETGINAAVCGYYGVPVVLVTGDDAVVREAQELLPGVTTVAVKKAFSRYAAACWHPERARAAIRQAAQAAVQRLSQQPVAPLQLAAPVRVEVEFANTAMADAALLIPGSLRLDPRTVALEHPDYLTAFKAMRAMIALAEEAT